MQVGFCGKWNVNGETATRNRKAGEGLRTKNDSGAEFIMAVPGPADTAVGTRIMLNAVWR